MTIYKNGRPLGLPPFRSLFKIKLSFSSYNFFAVIVVAVRTNSMRKLRFVTLRANG